MIKIPERAGEHQTQMTVINKAFTHIKHAIIG